MKPRWTVEQQDKNLRVNGDTNIVVVVLDSYLTCNVLH